jgi:polysaccharide pyruvyl transferase WcaK-like protein
MRSEVSHLKKFAEVVDCSLRSGNVKKCVIITQCHLFEGYQGFESDSDISCMLYDLLKEKDKTVLIDEALSPNDLLCLYGGAKITLGMRLHSVILSLVSGTPSLAFTYFGHKTIGIMEMLEQGDNCFDATDFLVDEVIHKIKVICDNIEGECLKVKNKVELIHKQALNTPKVIQQILNCQCS